LLADYFPHLVEYGDAPRGDDIYETTRFIVQPAKRTRASLRQAKARLLAPLVDWCLQKHLSYFQTVIDAGALSSYVEITPHTRILGLAHPFGGGREAPGGGECMALRWPVIHAVFEDVIAYGEGEDPHASLARERAHAVMN
jgi:N-acyl-L-homoserine lactone synthetase